ISRGGSSRELLCGCWHGDGDRPGVASRPPVTRARWTNFTQHFRMVLTNREPPRPPVVFRMTESRTAHAQPNHIEAQCVAKGMRMTEQRRVIARVLSGSGDHPDVEELFRRCVLIDSRISISTVYRTVKLFEDAGIVERHDFRAGRARYEQLRDSHHDHLIDL